MKRVLSAVFFCVIALATSSYGQPVTGVHFDVEPASLPGGAVGNAAQFLQLMQKLKAVTNGVTKLSADIPMGMGPKPLGAWYYNNRPIAYAVADIVDVVTLMAYRDSASASGGIIDHAKDFLDYAKQIGKKVTVGVETNCDLGDIVSFCEEGDSYMEGQLGIVDSTLKSYGSSYGGLVVHDYTGYSALAGSASLPASAPCRGMWVWSHSPVTDSSARSKFIDFCKRMRVCTVLQESQGLVDNTNNAAKLKSFVLDLYAAGIQTELMFGNADWTYTANQGQAVALAQASVNFIKSLGSTSSGGGSGSSTTAKPVSTTGKTASTTGKHTASTTGVPDNGGGCGQRTITRRYRVTDGNDDVEQQIQDNNYVYCTSSDLELTTDGKTDQIVGLRFLNVDIGADDTIVNAYLEMKSKSKQTKKTNLVIKGEKSVNSGVLCDQSKPPSARPQTRAQVSWSSVPQWAKNSIYQSPDISSVVSEVVQQGGWKAGNAMSFFISGSGMRQAVAYNGGAAPYLVVKLKTIACGADYGNETDTTTDWWADGPTATADDSRDYNSAAQLSMIAGLALFSLFFLLFL